MNKYKSIEQIVDYYQQRYNVMADQADGVPVPITNEMIDLEHLEMCKEVDEVVKQEKFVIKCKNKLYKKMLSAKRKIATLEKADAWFDKVFRKYFNKGILEHLIVYAIRFLYRNELFVPKRLFSQINNDELLAQFTLSAIEHLGWNAQNEAAEPPTTDEKEIEDKEQDEDETPADDEETPKDEECTDVTVYEPKEVQPTEPQAQPVVKMERTITHEVLTTTGTPPSEPLVTDDADDGTDENGEAPPPTSTQKEVPHFYRAGGKNGKK